MSNWHESEHPRDRRGRFTDAGDWAGAVAEAMGFDETLSNTRAGRASLLRRVRNDLEGARLSGDSGDERHVTFYHPADEGRAVVRARYRHYDDEEDYWGDDEPPGMSDAEIAQMRDAEVRTALVAEAIGAPVPATVADPDDERVTLMAYVVGDFPDYNRWNSVIGTDEGVRIALLDLLVNNQDRSANWIITPFGTPVGIDHTQTMQASIGEYEPGPRGAAITSPFVSRHFTEQQVQDDSYRRWKDNPLHPDDILELRRRIDRLAADGVVEGAMLRHMELVLEHIAPHAAGTRRLIQ